MFKKIIILICIVVLIGILGVTYFLRSSLNQIKLQYDNETISEYKRQIDFTPFEDGLSKLTTEDMSRLSNLIIEKDISSLQANILKGKLTCEEIVLFYVNRIKQNDSSYNTVIQLNPNALRQAQALDNKISNDKNIKSLFSTVMLIKDNISDKDMNTSAGAYVLKDLTTNRDSFIVNKLKEDDAIILGKSNLSEWSNYLTMLSSNGFSVLGGQTKNAYGKYDVGGSSSGSCASVALNFCNVSLGSETSGSLIYPASQNSVVALKPTLGLLSRDLIIPISEAQDTAGVIGKSVRDVSLVFKTTLGADKNDKLSNNAMNFDKTQLQTELNKTYLKGKKIALLKERSDRNKLIIEELLSLGAIVKEVEIDPYSLNTDMQSVLNYGIIHDLSKFLNDPAVNSNVKSLEEIVAYNSKDESKRIPFGQSLHEAALDTSLSKDEYEKIVSNNRKLSQELIDGLLKEQDYDVIVSFSNDLSALYSPATYPALTVPSGYSDNGEPYGITFIGSLNDDYKLINIGYSYEQYTKHRKEPTMNN